MWKDRAIAATRGSQFGAILSCAMDVEREALPRFVGKAIITSDGFITCNFISGDGVSHHGAFVNSVEGLIASRDLLAGFLELSPEDRLELKTLLDDWVVINYHSNLGGLT